MKEHTKEYAGEHRGPHGGPHGGPQGGLYGGTQEGKQRVHVWPYDFSGLRGAFNPPSTFEKYSNEVGKDNIQLLLP